MQNGERKDLLTAIASPDVLFWAIFILFGGVAAGWFLMGSGAILGLLPLFAISFYRFARKRKRK